MLAATGILFFFAWRGRAIGRAHGLVLLAAYALYLGAVFSAPSQLTAMLSPFPRGLRLSRFPSGAPGHHRRSR